MSTTATPARTVAAVLPDRTDGHPPTAGAAALAAGLMMMVGAAFWAAGGADLDAAVVDGTMANYLADAADGRTMALVNVSLWTAAMPVFVLAAIRLAALPTVSPRAATLGRAFVTGLAPVAATAFVTMAVIIGHLATATPDVTTVVVADALGAYASWADWVATIALVGIGPAAFATAGRGTWAPDWLVRWGQACAVFAVLTTVALFTGGLGTFGFAIVPVGLGWMIAAGVTLLRR